MMNTDKTYDRYWEDFTEWIAETYGDGTGARTAVSAIKNRLEVTSPASVAGQKSIPTTPLTPSEVEMCWPILMEKDYPLYVLLRAIYETGIDHAFLLGDGGDYDGLKHDHIVQVGCQWFADLHKRGGQKFRYRISDSLAIELRSLIDVKTKRVTGRPSIHPSVSVWGISKAGMYKRIRSALKELQERGIVRSNLRGAFRLWSLSPRIRLGEDPRFRDAREGGAA